MLFSFSPLSSTSNLLIIQKQKDIYEDDKTTTGDGLVFATFFFLSFFYKGTNKIESVIYEHSAFSSLEKKNDNLIHILCSF